MNRPIRNESSVWQKNPVSFEKKIPLHLSFFSLSFLALFLTMAPLLAQTPKFYGLTAQGGKDGIGAIIEYDINSKSLRDPAPTGFTNFVPGASPLYFEMTEFNGKLYGMTRNGGTFFGGVLFEYDPFTGVYLKKHDFSLFSNPFGGLAVVNGKLYGTTSSGENNAGVIFEYDPATEIYLEKFEFTAANRDRDGLSPSGGLVNVGDELFGMTSSGGVNNLGVIYSFNSATGTYTKIHDFESVNGSYPYGNLKLYNGDLYGSAYAGGTTGNGVLFKLSSSGAYSVLYHFLEGSDNTNQIADLGNLTVFNDKLYGTRPKGGSNDMGFVFEFDPTGSGITKYDFDGNNGKSPYGSLTEFDGKLYGMTTYGTPSDLGVLFEFNPVDKIISSRHNFAKESGSSPLGSLTNFNSKLYGMTSYGGLNDVGVIFEFDPIIPLYTKNLSFNETNGSNPTGSLINYNGKLFGTADAGGTYNLGVLFEYDPATERYTKNIDFVGDNGSGPNGALTAYNGKLYGMTAKGGRFIDHGLIYEYDPVTKTYTKQHEFDGTNGSSPQGGLTEYNGILYGMTSGGGTSGVGVLFGYNPSTRGLMLHDFNGTTGVSPRGSLTVYNGKLYGTTSGGGSGNGGVLFEFDPLTGAITEKYNFDQNNGWFPNGSLIIYRDKLYGMTRQGGRPDKGVIFEYDPVTNIYTSKHAFGGIDGDAVVGSLTEYNGKLYGMTSRGGVDSWGNVFEYDLRFETFVSNAEFNFSNGAVPLGSFTLFDVNLLPTASVLSVNGPTTICNGELTNLVVNITGGTSPYKVVYSDGTTEFTLDDYISGTDIPIFPSVPTTYSLVSITDANLVVGTGNSGTPTVIVSPVPKLSVKIGDYIILANNDGNDDKGAFSVCNTENNYLASALIDQNGSNDPLLKINQTYSSVNVNANLCDNCTSLLPFSREAFTASLINPEIDGSLTLRFRPWLDANNNDIFDGNECAGDLVEIIITVIASPTVVATPLSQTICSGSSITDIVLSGSGTTYSWVRDNPAGISGIAENGSGDISGTLTNTSDAPVTVTFTITPTINDCPGAAITASVIVNPAPTWYLDVDGDGYYVSSIQSCTNPGEGYKTTGNVLGDCNDNDVNVWQSATLYIDADGDGYDAGVETICYGADIPTGYSLTTNGTDCNDDDLSINPGAIEICGNGIDDNCDGQIDEGCGICPLPQGDWKNNPSDWPVTALPMMLGTYAYSKTQLVNLLNTTAKGGDASLILAYQLIAAKLNVANGGGPSQEVLDAIGAGDAAIGNKLLPAKVKSNTALGSTMTTLGATLEQYNKGMLNAGCYVEPSGDQEAIGNNNMRVVADFVEVPWNTPSEEIEKKITSMSSDWFEGKDVKLNINTDSYNSLQPGSYQLRTELMENEWFELEEPITVNVLVADKPLATDIRLSNSILLRNINAGTVIGDLSTIDPVDDQHTYSIAEHVDFELVGQSLIWKGNVIPATARITVFSTDRVGQTIERVIELSREPRFGDFNMFPNPASSEVNLEVELEQSMNVGIRIYDAIGRLVYQEEGIQDGIATYQIAIDHLSPGLYTVQMKTGILVMNKRLIKK